MGDTGGSHRSIGYLFWEIRVEVIREMESTEHSPVTDVSNTFTEHSPVTDTEVSNTFTEHSPVNEVSTRFYGALF